MDMTKLRLLILALVMVVAILLVAAGNADQVESAQVPEEQLLVEWDGTTLNTRTVTVSSAAEREFLDGYNKMNRMLVDAAADAWQRYQGGGSPERNVIETEYGTVTVERRVTESDRRVSTLMEISVEIERVETPYGLITVEKQSFGEPDEKAAWEEGDSGGQPLGLSE